MGVDSPVRKSADQLFSRNIVRLLLFAAFPKDSLEQNILFSLREKADVEERPRSTWTFGKEGEEYSAAQDREKPFQQKQPLPTAQIAYATHVENAVGQQTSGS